MARIVALCAALLVLGGPAATAQESGSPIVNPGDFRVLAVDRTFNFKLGSAVGTVEFRRDGTLIYRPRSSAQRRSDLDGAWGFSGSRLCMRIATLNNGRAECGQVTMVGPNDFEVDTGAQIFR